MLLNDSQYNMDTGIIESGPCGHCGKQDRLEFTRYGYAICFGCEHTIAASLQLVKKAYCRSCRRRFSWLWGKYHYDRGFRCRACLEGTRCQRCQAAPADKLVDTPLGPLWMCAADAKGRQNAAEEKSS